MKTGLRISVLVIVLCGLLNGLAFAFQFDFGALRGDVAHEDKLSFGPHRRFNLMRNQVEIPKAYGRLVTITASNNVAILWFESTDGIIRNVNLDAAIPLTIGRSGELN
jgi:hypothetical protein